jgi:hypothetical protein
MYCRSPFELRTFAQMISIGNTLVSEELLEEKFVCDLTRCKGHCCVEGDSGAPLEKEELKQLEEVYPVVKEMLTEEGRKSIEEQGLYLIDGDGDYVTPLVGGYRECAFTVFDNGIAKCGIEKAYLEGKVNFRKPVSCHLYPVRITRYRSYDAVNYERWSVCAPACKLGEHLKVPVYVFLKDSLTRKYGEKWYAELSLAAEVYQKERT